MDVGASDVVTLAPLCQGSTHIQFYDCGVTPSLEFWRQLVQLMPTITNVVFEYVEGSTTSAMHQSLQLMADQPWARWLDICIEKPSISYKLPACWQASPLTQPGKLRVQPAAHNLHTLNPSGAESQRCLAPTAALAGCHAVDQVAAGLWWSGPAPCRAAGQQQSVQGPADSSAAVPCCLGPWGCCLADGATGSKGKMQQGATLSCHCSLPQPRVLPFASTNTYDSSIKPAALQSSRGSDSG
ncbi:hypothetical protein V8C86DRAFT_3026955 [Haematococcus lacustris]